MKEIVGASLDTGSKIALETNHFVSIVFRSLSFKSSSSAGITLFVTSTELEIAERLGDKSECGKQRRNKGDDGKAAPVSPRAHFQKITSHGHGNESRTWS